jgi:hypothetical protein
MLTFEEKGIPYNKLLIDELNMPEWYARAQLIFVVETLGFPHPSGMQHHLQHHARVMSWRDGLR